MRVHIDQSRQDGGPAKVLFGDGFDAQRRGFANRFDGSGSVNDHAAFYNRRRRNGQHPVGGQQPTVHCRNLNSWPITPCGRERCTWKSPKEVTSPICSPTEIMSRMSRAFGLGWMGRATSILYVVR